MTLADDIVRDEPGLPANLRGRDPAWKAGPTFEAMATDELKAVARGRLERLTRATSRLDLSFATVRPERLEAIEKARANLLAEA